MINFVIKIEEGLPTGDPMAIENFQLVERVKRYKPASTVTKEDVEAKGYAPFRVIDKPQDGVFLKVVDNGYILGVDGWVQSDFSLEEKTDEELDDTQLEAEYRGRRDLLLAETDWMATADNTISTEMSEYRQALRDISSHANWPRLNIEDWPIDPRDVE
jgi:hypothetical protein